MALKLPPPVLFLLTAMLIYFLPHGSNYPLPQWLSYLLAGIGISIDLAGLYAFRQAQTTVNPLTPNKSSTLVTTGIYRFSRNPMYLGQVFLLVAWAVWLNRYFSAIVIIGFVMYLNRFQIEPEERVLAQKFGQAFEDYQTKVRRWL